MEGNKDSARECLKRGNSFFQNQDYEKAYKFYKKSNDMFKTDAATQMMKQAEIKMNNNGKGKDKEKNANENSGNQDKGGLKSSDSFPGVTPSSSRNSLNIEYTFEQEELVKRILENKTHYEVLGLDQNTAEETDIKKSFRKLARQLHPDKNKAPGADEAFKKIEIAHRVLSDPETRSHYDNYGDGDPSKTNFAGKIASFSAFEFIMMFFESIAPDDIKHHEDLQARNSEINDIINEHCKTRNSFFGRIYLIILTILIYCYFVIFASYQIPAPSDFSLEKTSIYSKSMTSLVFGSPYFVSEKMYNEIEDNENRHKIDLEVETYYLKYLQFQCQKEQTLAKQKLNLGEYYQNGGLLAEAYNAPLDNCKKLRKYKDIRRQS